MDLKLALSELEELAKKLEIEVVYDHFTGDGMGGGGLCKLRGQWRVIVERKGSEGEKISILARAVGRFDLDAHFISPAVRELIARTTGKSELAPTPEAESPAEPEAEAPAEPEAEAPAESEAEAPAESGAEAPAEPAKD